MFSGDGWPLWLVWILYIVSGTGVLGMLWWPMRKATRWLSLPVLALLAGLIYTPVPIETGSAHWAPATLVFIFELEKYGTAMIMRTLGPILLTSLGFLLLALALPWPSSRSKRTAKSSHNQV